MNKGSGRWAPFWSFCFDYPPQDISMGTCLGLASLENRLEVLYSQHRVSFLLLGNIAKGSTFLPTGDSGSRGLGESPAPGLSNERGCPKNTEGLGPLLLLLPHPCNPSDTSTPLIRTWVIVVVHEWAECQDGGFKGWIFSTRRRPGGVL